MCCNNQSGHHLSKIGATITRLGLAFVVIWFGASQLKNPELWTDMVPNFAINLTSLSATALVTLNGWFELIFGLILACGFLIGPVALLLGLHVLSIAFSIGFNSVAVRDFGLASALIGLGLKYLPKYSYCHYKKEKSIEPKI